MAMEHRPLVFHILQSPCSDDKDQTVWDIGVKSDSIRREADFHTASRRLESAAVFNAVGF
jgi:hypothetical protein